MRFQREPGVGRDATQKVHTSPETLGDWSGNELAETITCGSNIEDGHASLSSRAATLASRSMLLLIIAGVVYSILTDSLAVAILTGSLILYRAQRPSKFNERLREKWYQFQGSRVGDAE